MPCASFHGVQCLAQLDRILAAAGASKQRLQALQIVTEDATELELQVGWHWYLPGHVLVNAWPQEDSAEGQGGREVEDRQGASLSWSSRWVVMGSPEGKVLTNPMSIGRVLCRRRGTNGWARRKGWWLPSPWSLGRAPARQQSASLQRPALHKLSTLWIEQLGIGPRLCMGHQSMCSKTCRQL